MFELLSKLVWEEPFQQPSSHGAEDETNAVLPVTFMNNKTNVDIEEERTVVHGRGGKGFAIVETNLARDGCVYEWKVISNISESVICQTIQEIND